MASQSKVTPIRFFNHCCMHPGRYYLFDPDSFITVCYCETSNVLSLPLTHFWRWGSRRHRPTTTNWRRGVNALCITSQDFEQVMGPDPALAVNWVVSFVLGHHHRAAVLDTIFGKDATLCMMMMGANMAVVVVVNPCANANLLLATAETVKQLCCSPFQNSTSVV